MEEHHVASIEIRDIVAVLKREDIATLLERHVIGQPYTDHMLDMFMLAFMGYVENAYAGRTQTQTLREDQMYVGQIVHLRYPIEGIGDFEPKCAPAIVTEINYQHHSFSYKRFQPAYSMPIMGWSPLSSTAWHHIEDCTHGEYPLTDSSSKSSASV